MGQARVAPCQAPVPVDPAAARPARLQPDRSRPNPSARVRARSAGSGSASARQGHQLGRGCAEFVGRIRRRHPVRLLDGPDRAGTWAARAKHARRSELHQYRAPFFAHYFDKYAHLRRAIQEFIRNPSGSIAPKNPIRKYRG